MVDVEKEQLIFKRNLVLKRIWVYIFMLTVLILFNKYLYKNNNLVFDFCGLKYNSINKILKVKFHNYEQ